MEPRPIGSPQSGAAWAHIRPRHAQPGANHRRLDAGWPDGLRTALEALARERGVAAELRCVDGIASAVVPQHARYTDLCILGRDQPEGPASIEYTFAEHL